MKLFGLSTILLVIFASTSVAQSGVHSSEQKLVDVAVNDLEIEAENINKLLPKIAYKYGVPISLEIATNEDLLKSKGLRVQVKKGTLADVLDQVVRQKTSYTWEAAGSTIRVFPKSDFRDPLLQTLLEMRISHFTLRKSIAKLNFRQALTRRPELKELLASYGVRPSNEAFSRYDIEPFGGDFSLDVENMSVRSILDSVIQNSKTKYWFIKRDEENKGFFLINF